MSYNLWKADDPKEIKEQEYAIASEIKFGHFTSCLGVIGKAGGSLYAVHLVKSGVLWKEMYGLTLYKGKPVKLDTFDTTVAANVLSIFPQELEQVVVVGFIDEWRNKAAFGMAKGKQIDAEAFTRQAAFNKLLGVLGTRTNSTILEYTWAEANYAAKISEDGHDIEMLY